MARQRQPITPIGDELVEAFKRDGAVCLYGAFDVSWLEVLSRGIEKNLADLGPGSCRYTKDGAPGNFVDDYCNWQRFDEYRDFIFDSGVGEVAARLMESKTARLFHEHVLVKEPGTQEVSPWHQDLPYYCVDGEQLVSVWTPLDPVPQFASPEFVAGSHRWGRLFAPRKFVDHRAYEGALESFEPVPDIEAERDQHQILSWGLEPGDCIVFHMRTLHGAPGTASLKTRRRGFSTRWLGDDAVFATRPFKTSPPFEGLGLSPGVPMEHELFPVVYRGH